MKISSRPPRAASKPKKSSRPKKTKTARAAKPQADSMQSAPRAAARLPLHVDARRTGVSEAGLKARGLEAEVTWLYRLARGTAATGPRGRLDDGKATLAEVHALAAAALFGDAAGKKSTYVQLEEPMKRHGLLGEFDEMLAHLPRAELKRVLAGELSPTELFTRDAEALASWRTSNEPLAPSKLMAELKRDPAWPELEEAVTQLGFEKRTVPLSPRDAFTALDGWKRHNADVLVIGAGMAGLEAANTVLDGGRSVVVVEKRDRVAGRAHTTWAESLGMTIEAGAQYLHNPDHNELTPFVKERGFTTTAADGGATYWFDGKKLEDGEKGKTGAWEHEYHAMMAAVKEAAAQGKDLPLPEVYRNDTPLGRLVRNDMGAGTLGVDPKDISSKDLALKTPEAHGLDDNTVDQFLVQGMGTFIASFAHGVPVELGKEIRQVQVGKDFVSVTTASGETYRGKTAIITLPPAALLKGDIKFNPPLSAEKLEQLKHLPLGHFKKILMRFDAQAFPKAIEHSAIYDLSDSRIEYLVGAGNKKGLVFAMVGGELSLELEKKGDEATLAFMRKQLARFVPGVEAHYRGGFVSPWEKSDGGAYTVAAPGHQDAREKAAQPEAEGRVRFASEAYDTKWPTYLPGAFRSGQKEGEEALEVLEKLEKKK